MSFVEDTCKQRYYLLLRITQIQVSWDDGADFSGCHVVGDRPIFVQSGAYISSVGTFKWPDHLAEVLPTISQLGVRYYTAPFMRRTINDIIKIIGECKTKIPSVLCLHLLCGKYIL